MVFPLTRVLSEFASTLTFEDVPDAAIAAARLGFTDTVACNIAGFRKPGPSLLRESLQTIGVVTESRLCLGDVFASSADAAMANTTAIASLEFDDVALRGSHPSSIMVPAILAEADRIGASGKAALTAYVAGFEVWARLIDREQDAYLQKGWQVTAVIGPIAGAAAVANLLGLSPSETASALGFACAASGGLTASFSSEARLFQVGLAARNAVVAARLAQSGLAGGDSGIEGNGGILSALSPNGNVDLDSDLTDLGTEWRLANGSLNFKNYPMILAAHRAIDGMSEVVGEHEVRLSDVEKVTLFIGPEQLAHRKRMSGGGKRVFMPLSSFELGLAAMIVDRTVSFKHLEPAFYAQPAVQDFMRRVTIQADESIGPDLEPNLGFAARLRVETKDGRTLESHDAPVPRGNWRNPMTAEQHWNKFRACAEGNLAEAKAQRLFDCLQELESLTSVRELDAR